MADSRSALLAAAAEEFAKHGPRGTRVQDIVKRAGVNERMIYHHFGNKDGLYAAALADQQERQFAAWLPALEKAVTLPPYEGMRMALGGFVEALMAYPLMVKLWMHESLGGWQTLPLPENDAPVTQMREIYERGQREGVFRKDCPFLIAHATAMSALIGMPVISGRGEKVVKNTGLDVDSAAIGELIIGQLLDGMSGPR